MSEVKSIKMLSLDPASTKNLGWSVITLEFDEESGELNTLDGLAGTFVFPTTEEYWQVLWPMFCTIDNFFQEQQPDIVIVEKTSSFSGSFITGQVSNCMGVILACCGRHDLDTFFVFPTHVKKVISGKGKATKTMMKKSVQKILGSFGLDEVKFDSEHACDATANILTYVFDEGILLHPFEDQK